MSRRVPPATSILPKNVPDLSALYETVLLDHTSAELERKLRNRDRVRDNASQSAGNSRQESERQRQANQRALNHKRGQLDKALKNHTQAQVWVAEDFSETRLPTPDELFTKEEFRRRMELAVRREKVPTFEPATINGPRESPLEHVDSQNERLKRTYTEYVNRNTNKSIVNIWTRDTDITGDAPPHQVMEYVLLNMADVYTNKDFNDTIDMFDFSRTRTLAYVRMLYDLVVNAPRCPSMMCLSRVVRSENRLPSAWFKTKTGRSMKEGDCVMLPIFLSTSNMLLADSWLQHGEDSVDEYGEPCCAVQIVVPKGVPMLPLFDFNSNDHQHENEVLLPPGVELVYLGNELVSLSVNLDMNVEFYVAQTHEPG